MATPNQNYNGDKTAGLSDREAIAQIEALREQLNELTGQAKAYAEDARDAVSNATHTGAVRLKYAVRKHPTASMFAAVGAGAALAFILTPRREQRDGVQQIRGYLPDTGHYNISNLTASIERAIDRAQPRESLSSVGNRLAEGANELNVGGNLEAAAERAMSWWDAARKRVS